MFTRIKMLGICLFLLLFAGIVGCAQSTPEVIVVKETQVVVMAEEPVVVEKEVPAPAEVPAEVQSADSSDLAPMPQPGRMIIKNGELHLEVGDTDVAIDRITQMIYDLGGYIISSQTYYQESAEKNYKYATLNVGVPSGDFEVALRRLREIAERVVDETASGQDVTEEFVDLESKLENLKVTRDRIREFLDQAKTVEEALKVNDQLSSVEEEIATIQGRMNYLQDRSAFSTIMISLAPVIPTATPGPTPTTTPTPTSTPWAPVETFRSAGSILGDIWRELINTVIYVGVVCVPFLLPLALLVWFGLWLRKRMRARRKPVPPVIPQVEEEKPPEVP